MLQIHNLFMQDTYIDHPRYLFLKKEDVDY